MQNILHNWLKKLLSDAHAAVVGIVLCSLLAGGYGIYVVVKYVWNELIKIAQFPIPLWATIALVLLSGVYVYIKTAKSHSSFSIKIRTDFIEVGRLK